jgi:hypothetical protein
MLEVTNSEGRLLPLKLLGFSRANTPSQYIDNKRPGNGEAPYCGNSGRERSRKTFVALRFKQDFSLPTPEGLNQQKVT